MSLFISSNSTKALIAKTDSLKKKVDELEKQKKSKISSFIGKIKSFSNSSAKKAGIQKKLNIKPLETLEKELDKAKSLKDKLSRHKSNLGDKKLKKELRNGGKNRLNQLLGGTKKDASQKRLIRKINDDLNKATESSKLYNKTCDTMTKLDDKIQFIKCSIAKANNIKEFAQSLIEKRQGTTNQSGVNASGNLIEL